MLNGSFKNRLIPLIAFTQRSMTIQSDADLNVQMKLLNDKKQFKKTLELFDIHKEKYVKTLSSYTINQALKACAQMRDLQRGLNIHRQISSRLSNDYYILASLIHFYMQCREVARAESLFNVYQTKSNGMYGAMMKGYIKNNMAEKAIDLFNEIQSPDEIVTTTFFNACAQLETTETLMLIKKVLKNMPQSFQSDPILLTSLLDALMKCSDVTYAESIFNKLTKKSLAIYGAMMKGYIKNNMAEKAIDLFNEIQSPDEIVTTTFFNACAQLETTETLMLIKKVLKNMPQSFQSDHILLTSLLDALMKHGEVTYAESIFNRSMKKSLNMYGAMMKGYIKNKMAKNAIDLFNEIPNPGDIVTNLLFNACAQLETIESLNLVKNVFEEMPKSFHSNSFILTSLLDALMKHGEVTYAESIFNRSRKKSLNMYGAMMKGYIKNEMAKKAINLYNEIQNPDDITSILLFNACSQLETTEALNLVKKVSREIPKSYYSNPVISISILDALIKCGDISSAEIFFSKMKKSVIDYGSLMSGFLKENNPEKVLNLFNEMKMNDIEANKVIYLNVIKALSHIADYKLSESYVKQIPTCILADSQIHNSLIHMWGKVGYVDKAKQTFQNISQPDLIAYTSMINSYGLNGMGYQAIELYFMMPKEFIHEATNVSVLNACSHSALVDEARSIFKNVQIKTEKIYTAMIDCLSRASLFDEAQLLIKEFECHHPPSWPMYMTILSGARNEKHCILSQTMYDRMKMLFPDMTDPLTSAAILLANTYASSGETEISSKIKRQLIKSNIKKKIGLSWTVINNQVFRFRAHDQSHPRSSEIYAEVDKISKELTEHGYTYDSSWITRPLNQDETIASVLCGHSERLAIAFNFIANPNTSLIQVAKNLRVCGDCHKVTKLIAAIRQCEIIVRDANRIHHFYKNGKCSCNDYF